MANPEHLAILQKGVEQWNRWRQDHPEQRSAKIEKSRLGGSMAEVSVVWVDSDSPQGLGSLWIQWGSMENPVIVYQKEFSPPDLRDADLSYAKLRGADFGLVNLARADLHGADLRRVDFQFANLRQTNLLTADLTEANLGKADLLEADLRAATINGTEMSWAMLAYADLSELDLRWVSLSTAHLQGAKLNKGNLSGTDLSRSVLKEADLSGANLTGIDFTLAEVGGTIFADVDLSSAKGLETVWHAGPSTIGIDTIYRSRGKIPEVFLRGCGVPDEFIAYMGSLVGRPIEFYSCFISYSKQDQEFTDRLYADLQAKGVRCWFAPHDIKGGRKLHEQLDEAIRSHDKLLLILSEHSMSSNWVKTEVANAREREERERKQKLFPITLAPFDKVKQWKLFDADTGIDSAREIREYFIPDFSNWKDHDSYQSAFQRLMRDLKSGSRHLMA
jgi:uncharacterized protein YjbI with pentapeptide repeats